ncbi:MAG: PorP/SprF family type IX secretion system membrane protein [Bacteroidia bacterium]
MKNIFTRFIFLVTVRMINIRMQAFIVCICSGLNVVAQDVHFSQYYNTPLLVNPANAGNGIEHMRATLIYRKQWASVTNPYTSQGFMIDKKVNKVGFGFHITQNSTGDAGLKQLNMSGVLSFNQPLGETNQLTAALQVGLNNKSFDPTKMTFDNQFTEDAGFDPSINSGEVFTTTSITRPDLGAGLMWQKGFGMEDVKFKPFIGVAFAHLNKPSETFIVDNNKLPVKSTYNLGAGIMLKENLEIRPSMIYMVQDHFHEVNFGATSTFTLSNNNKFQLGLFNRSGDALVAYAGYQVNRMFIGTSYDINTSSLKEVSHGSGGFEITLSYIPKAKKKAETFEPKKNSTKKSPAKKEKIQKTAKVTTPAVEQTISVPDKIEPAKVQPQVVAPKVEKQKTEPVTTDKETIKPIVEEKINVVTPSTVKSKEQKANITVKIESKPAAEEKVVSAVVVVEAAPVKEKPVEVKQPAIEERKAEIKQPVVTEKPKAIVEMPVVVENKTVDTDGDGINDNVDLCPYIKGGIATNGCPDSDNDGIIDMKDKCPMEPGTVKAGGCPEIKYSFDKAQLIEKFNNIEFETGKSTVKTNDVYDIIEYAIDIMYEYPDSRIILSGHTDSEGNELFNMQLSEMRNNVVKQYLINQGIDASRIQTINYGETMPLSNNTSEYGKARNRRVEINILKGNK